MSDWLHAVRETLDASAEPVRIFFRDDDAGWADNQLYALLDEFAKAKLPMDLAVIPGALQQRLAEELIARGRQNDGLLGLHQHGCFHANHELTGRKCEFGPSRSRFQQKYDIETGRKRLQAVLGGALDPYFTPPWNRCTQDTVACLEELGFKLLSRNAAAQTLETSRVQQVPVHVDWSWFFKTSANALAELGQAIAANLKNHPLTGIMLHHADMDALQLKPLAELLAVIADHNNAQGTLLRDTLG